uniref:Uncharacterized protein n=1 Tax=Plectus sambesii TaxID=2011161 RepID=A0A914XSD3_9BILA
MAAVAAAVAAASASAATVENRGRSGGFAAASPTLARWRRLLSLSLNSALSSSTLDSLSSVVSISLSGLNFAALAGNSPYRKLRVDCTDGFTFGQSTKRANLDYGSASFVVVVVVLLIAVFHYSRA